MGRTSFEDQDCGIARALEILGDWWTLLVVREAFFGTRRFRDFQKNLGIARNILSQRLNLLVQHGILEPVDAGRYGTRFEYRLTGKGEDLLPVLTALREWGDRWTFGAGGEPLIFRDRATRRQIPRLEVRDADGRALGRRDIVTEPGPGASPQTRSRFARPLSAAAPAAEREATPGRRSPADPMDGAATGPATIGDRARRA